MRVRFTEAEIQKVPEEAGIFCLFQERDLVYIGRTPPRSGLRSELARTLRVAMAADMLASEFTYELTVAPKTRANEELRSYYETCGRLPIYNRAHGIEFDRATELRR
jgi:hypothetical protein